MYPVRALSLYDGWNILTNENHKVWAAINEVLLAMLPIVKGERQTARQMATLGNIKLKLKDLPEIWENAFHSLINWSRDDFDMIYRTRNYYDNPMSVINKVAIQMVSLSSHINLSKRIFVEAPRAIRESRFNLSVLLVPENGVLNLFGNPKELSRELPFNESNCRRQIEGFLPIPYGSPFVIIFFSQFKKSIGIQVEELPTLAKDAIDDSVIERSLEFAPEYTQAGISVLSYFSEVLRQKYPDLNVKVRIEQQGTTVLMHVELPSGDVDTIKEELATYFLVVAGKEKPEALLSNPLHIMALENKLQIANMELRMSYQLNAHLTNELGSLKTSQQRMEETFKAQIAEQGVQIRTLINLAAQQSASHERVQLAQIGHTGAIFQSLVVEAGNNQVVLMAIRSLEHNLMSGIALIDIQDQLNTSLATIKQEKPSLLNHLAGQVESAGFGAVGSFIVDWIGKHA